MRTRLAGQSYCAVLALLHVIACSNAGGSQPGPERAASLAVLGHSLFLDPALSDDGKTACASCHQPERACTDGRPQASGAFGRNGVRNTPSILDVARQRSLFWDGRRERLEEQALDPLLNHAEQGLRDFAQLLAALGAAPRYEAMARAAFGVPVAQLTDADITRALAAFERTLVSAPAPFDRFQRGQREAVSEAARRGWIVFDRQAHCTACHVASAERGERPLFTDHQFHSLAIGFGKIERDLPQLTARLVALRRAGQMVGRDVVLDAELEELGRFAVTLDPRDVGAFKTPGLRNVAVTAPYMHDGSVATLAEAVDREVYARGAGEARPLILTPDERSDIVAFLQSLTSDPG